MKKTRETEGALEFAMWAFPVCASNYCEDVIEHMEKGLGMDPKEVIRLAPKAHAFYMKWLSGDPARIPWSIESVDQFFEEEHAHNNKRDIMKARIAEPASGRLCRVTIMKELILVSNIYDIPLTTGNEVWLHKHFIIKRVVA